MNLSRLYSLFTFKRIAYALLFAAFCLRLGSLTFQSLWRDEVDAICFAQAPLLAQWPTTALTFTPSCPPNIPDLLSAFTQPGFNGPLYFLLLRGWIGLAGYGEYALRFLSVFCGVLSVAFLIVLGTRLFNRAVGLIAGALLALSAYQIWYSQEAKMYSLITLLVLAAIYCLRRGVEDGQVRWWVGVVGCTACAMAAHILAALLIPVEIALFVLWWPHSRKHWVAGLITLACLTLPYLPLAVPRLQWVFQPADTGFTRYSLLDTFSTLLSAYSGGVLGDLLPPGALLIRFLLLGLVLLGVFITERSMLPNARTDRRLTQLSLAAWIVLPVLLIALVSINRPIFTDRYLIWIQPAVYLAAAVGMVTLWKWWKPLAVIALSAIAIVNGWGMWQQATTPYKADFRSAARAIAPQLQPGDWVIFQMPYARHAFTYYFRQPFQAVDGPYTNYPGDFAGYQDSEETIFAQLSATLGARPTLWVVWSESAWADARNLLQRWLDAHGEITFHAEYPQVQVTRYELKPPGGFNPPGGSGASP